MTSHSSGPLLLSRQRILGNLKYANNYVVVLTDHLEAYFKSLLAPPLPSLELVVEDEPDPEPVHEAVPEEVPKVQEPVIA